MKYKIRWENKNFNDMGTLNHTTRLSIYIVDVIAIVCHLQEGEKQDDNRWKRISSPLTPHFTSTDTRPKVSFQLPLTPSTLIPPPLTLFSESDGTRQIEMHAI